jgi:hypothetical protein
VTNSESTARWFGPWERVPGDDDKKIRVQLAFEEGKPWTEGTIERCDEPHHLTIRTQDANGTWLLSLKLSETSGTTTLELIHHHIDRKALGAVGPGWEYYLDNLVAARERQPLPKFDSYYPSQTAYFEALEG